MSRILFFKFFHWKANFYEELKKQNLLKTECLMIDCENLLKCLIVWWAGFKRVIYFTSNLNTFSIETSKITIHLFLQTFQLQTYCQNEYYNSAVIRIVMDPSPSFVFNILKLKFYRIFAWKKLLPEIIFFTWAEMKITIIASPQSPKTWIFYNCRRPWWRWNYYWEKVYIYIFISCIVNTTLLCKC